MGISPAIASAASFETVRNALATRRALSLWMDVRLLHVVSVASASAQMGMPYVMTDVVTNVKSALLFCFGPPTFGMSPIRFSQLLMLLCWHALLAL